MVREVRVRVEGDHAADARTVALVDQSADPPVRRRRAGALVRGRARGRGRGS